MTELEALVKWLGDHGIKVKISITDTYYAARVYVFTDIAGFWDIVESPTEGMLIAKLKQRVKEIFQIEVEDFE